MSTPFLLRFAAVVVERLVNAGQIEIRDGKQAEVVIFLASRLFTPEHRSLISTLSEALIQCPDVEELFADDDDLKELIGGLDPVHARG